MFSSRDGSHGLSATHTSKCWAPTRSGLGPSLLPPGPPQAMQSCPGRQQQHHNHMSLLTQGPRAPGPERGRSVLRVHRGPRLHGRARLSQG